MLHAKRTLWLYRRRVSEGLMHRVGGSAVCCGGEQSDRRGAAAPRAGLQSGTSNLIVVPVALLERRPTTWLTDPYQLWLLTH